MRSFEWLVSKRYLFTRERRALVSVITLISMFGVAVGVAALIVVIGVMDGADELLFGKIADLYPHVRIMASDGDLMKVDDALLKDLRSRPEVLKAEPILQKLTLIQAEEGIEARKAVAQIIGIERLGKDSLYTISDVLKGQDVVLGKNEVLLGAPIAYHLQAPEGRNVLIMASNPVSTALGARAKIVRLRVKGYFRTNFWDFDNNTVFVHPDELRRLYRIEPGMVDYIHVKLSDPFRADKFASGLDLPEGLIYTTWSQENGAFFSALKLEKLGLFVILLLIILVAAFNIIGTLILMVIEKTREIGILRAIGASEGAVARIFLLDGVMIGLVGTALGLTIGLILCALIPMIEINMPASIYNFDHLPVQIKPFTVSVVVASSMLICTLAALFPAFQAARLDPVEALRYD